MSTIVPAGYIEVDHFQTGRKLHQIFAGEPVEGQLEEDSILVLLSDIPTLVHPNTGELGVGLAIDRMVIDGQHRLGSIRGSFVIRILLETDNLNQRWIGEFYRVKGSGEKKYELRSA